MYAPRPDESFAAANYPPLFLFLASLGAPFLAARLTSVAAAGAVAVLIGWRAWAAGPRVALALSLAWLACVPVLDWGLAAKPDALAVAFVVGAVLTAERRRVGWTGALLVCAIATKPTAVAPAAAILLWLATVDRRSLARLFAGAALPAAVLGAVLLWLGVGDAWRHIASWNVLGWDPTQLGLLAVVLVAVVGVPVLWALRLSGGVMRAYVIGALGIVVLGGREGATINYLLDVSAASFLALGASFSAAPPSVASGPISTAPPSVARGPIGAEPPSVASGPSTPTRGGLIAALIAAQLVGGVVALDPFGLTPGGTGHWGGLGRLDALRAALVPGRPALVEDAGLLVALGVEPVVDDLFLWSRLVERGIVDPSPLVAAVREARFALIAAEVDLRALGPAVPAYERARWAPVLVEAILARYDSGRRDRGLWLYRPR